MELIAQFFGLGFSLLTIGWCVCVYSGSEMLKMLQYNNSISVTYIPCSLKPTKDGLLTILEFRKQ